MKIKLLQYGLSTAVGLGIALWVMNLRGLFLPGLETAEAMFILCDSFFVPGVLLAGIGLLVWVATTGFFDSVGYAVHTALHLFLPVGRTAKKTYYDYKSEKEEKRGSTPRFLLVVGVSFILVSMVFLAIWYAMV